MLKGWFLYVGPNSPTLSLGRPNDGGALQGAKGGGVEM